jgi:hypothetical protein
MLHDLMRQRRPEGGRRNITSSERMNKDHSTFAGSFMYRCRRGLSLLACVGFLGACLHSIYRPRPGTDSVSSNSDILEPLQPLQPKVQVMATTESSITYQKVGEDPLVYAAVETATNEPLSVETWAQSMSQSERASTLAQDLTRLIRGTGYQGIFFETPGVSAHTAGQKQFRICIVDGPSVTKFASSHASSSAFQEHLDKCADPHVCSFPNLGGDAMLVVPQKQPGTKDPAYSHLAAFLREAPEEQIAQVWKKVASTYLQILQTRDETKPVWLSTEGTGVPWLHFRFDDRPKYYHYRPFANEV